MVNNFILLVVAFVLLTGVVQPTHYKPIPPRLGNHHPGQGGSVEHPPNNTKKKRPTKAYTIPSDLSTIGRTRTYVSHIGITDHIKTVAVAFHGEYMRKEVLIHTHKEGCSIAFNCFKNIFEAIIQPLDQLNISTRNFFGTDTPPFPFSPLSFITILCLFAFLHFSNIRRTDFSFFLFSYFPLLRHRKTLPKCR